MTVTLETQRQRSLDDACRCAQIAEEFRGRDIVVLDLTEVTPIFDYFVIATGTNPRQMYALADEIRVVMKAKGSHCHGTEGEATSNWLLQDYGDIVLHVFQPEARQLYDLERLWADAKRVNWREHLGLPPAPRTESL
ncbi:MAG: ribosome silencing factor [Planctomycetales bacterium 12-60-4]|nr:MAG: ribosome silencing factor [Planctomycetales bacterium 12-60-4]